MNDKLLKLLFELYKTDFFDQDYDVYLKSLEEMLLADNVSSSEVRSIIYFFKNVFFKDDDYTITCSFEKKRTTKRYVDFINNFDSIMCNVLKLGDKYNWPRRD